MGKSTVWLVVGCLGEDYPVVCSCQVVCPVKGLPSRDGERTVLPRRVISVFLGRGWRDPWFCFGPLWIGSGREPLNVIGPDLEGRSFGEFVN